MRIAIVIPALNEEAVIDSALGALAPLRANGAGGVSIVVVDGGSDDRTVELARAGADQVVVAPRGRARQMNAGAAAAVASGADAFVFLHADSTLPPGAIAAIANALGDRRRGWGRFDIAIDGKSRLLPLVAALMNMRSRVTGIATGDQAIFVTAGAFSACGGFPDWPLMEDVGISRALKRLSRPAALRLRVTTAGRRWDTHGALRTIALMWWLRLRFFLGAKPESLAASYTPVR